jgi:hypothetical protein
MRQYKIIARILLILPIIDFAFALPIAAQETCQLCGDVVPDVAIITSAKRGDEVEKQCDMDSDRAEGRCTADEDSSFPDKLSESDHAPPQSPTSSTAPDHGSTDPSQMGTSEIQQVWPELTKSPSLEHYLFVPVDPKGYLPESGSSVSSGPASVDSSSPMERSKFKNFLSKVFSKCKFWRRISSPGPVRGVVNVAQREFQGLVDTGVYVFSLFLRLINVPTL